MKQKLKSTLINDAPIRAMRMNDEDENKYAFI